MKVLIKNALNDTVKADYLNELSFEFLYENIDSSIYYNNLAYALSQKLDYKTGIGTTLLNNASIAEIEGDYYQAVELFHNALEIFKNQNDSYGIIQAYSNLGLTHYYLNDPEKSMHYSNLALEISRKVNKEDTGNIYNTLGLAYMASEKFDSALYYFEQSKYISIEQGIKSGVVYSSGNIANIYMSQQKYKEALEIYTEVRDISLKAGNKISLSLSHVNISNAYSELAENCNNDIEKVQYYNLALENAIASLYYAEELKSLTHINYAYYQLMISYKGLANYKDALKFAEKYIESTDSIFSFDKMKAIEKLENKFKLDNLSKEKKLKEDIIKKQDQIIFIGTAAIFLVSLLLIFVFVLYRRMKNVNLLLIQKNKAIESQRAEIAGQRDNLSELAFELKKINKTKDKFFSVLAHDLKNPFQSIIGFSELLKVQANKGEYKNTGQYADIIYDTSNKTYSLLENLLNWARFQRGMIKFDPKIFNLSKLIEECIAVSGGIANSKEIQIVNEINSEADVYIDYFLFSTIIRNLISNAVKFTERGGKIILRSEDKGENQIDVLVIDNGIGIRKGKISKLFKHNFLSSEKGTEDESGTGLGLIVCKEFAKKNKGDLNVISEEKVGSTFILTVLKKSE